MVTLASPGVGGSGLKADGAPGGAGLIVAFSALAPRDGGVAVRATLCDMHATTDRSEQLLATIEASGYYPDVVAEAVFAAVAGESVEAFLVHHEPTIDERDEVRRHVTVLVLTESRLVIAHTDEHPPDDMLPAPYTSSSTEAVALDAVRSVVVNRMVTNPATYAERSSRPSASVADEAVLTIGWGAVGRIDLEPAGCADPECDADHGYTGVLTSDDFSIRLSAAAEGHGAVADLLAFAHSLSARTRRSSAR